jgi:hypothetical protein
MSIRDVFRTFASLYLAQPPRNEPDMQADVTDICDLKEYYKNHRSHKDGNCEFAEYLPNGFFINHRDFHSRYITMLYCHRGFMIAEEPIAHEIPIALKEFRRYFSSDGTKFRMDGFRFPKRLTVMYDSFALISEPVIDPLSYTCDEWIAIFFDDNSDDRNGTIFINANPASEYFGRLAIDSSSDDEKIMVTQFQFDDFIEILIAHADILTGRNMGDDGRCNLCVADGNARISIIDFFNGFNSDDARNFNCARHFETRAAEVMVVLSDIILPDLAEIVANYIKYQDIPKYIPEDWDSSEDRMRRAGATDEIIEAMKRMKN